jgi:meiosis-specific serine/threonine-protein kinase MEK1
MDSYVLTSHCLGSGSFATVHLAVDTAAHRQVACKSIRTKKEGDLAKVMKEYTILMALHHVSRAAVTLSVKVANYELVQANINQVYDIQIDGKFLLVSHPPVFYSVFLTLIGTSHIFLELCTGGDLFTYITSYTETDHRLVEGEAKYITFQLLKGLKYLHDKMISHRGMCNDISQPFKFD